MLIVGSFRNASFKAQLYSCTAHSLFCAGVQQELFLVITQLLVKTACTQSNDETVEFIPSHRPVD